MDIGVLGPVEVWVDGDTVQLGGPKQRALLALLAATSPRVLSTDVLIEGLWGEEPSSGARSTLQTYVSNLRHALGGVLVHERGGYRLDVPAESIDATRFQQMLDEGRSTLVTDPATTAASLREALSLWRGRPYADLIDIPGLEPEVRRLEELRLEAVELRIDADLTSGLHGSLVAELEALAEEHPTREHFRAQHMLALYRSGRQADALRAFRRTESFLAEELGVDPSHELRELELKILQHDDSLLSDAGRAVTQRLAFLVTDIEGSTRLWDRNPQEMAGALASHDRVLRELIEGEGGNVFRHTGDGVLAAFPDAVSAVKAAEAALRSLAGSDWGQVGGLRVRMGIDVGEVETRGGDFFGPPLNRAARLCAIGHGGQVLVSSAALTEVSAAAPTGLQVRHLGEVHLRGMATPEAVAQLVIVGLQADFPDLRVDAESALDRRLQVLSVPGYEVRDRIGEGAFGVVWRAYQPSVGREVAIKVIRPELASHASFVRRFEAEARTIASLAHPHIVPLIDFWRDADSAYLVLGMLPGGSLATSMSAGSVDRLRARQVLGQIGSALDHAHSMGMVHGDLKPANVLLDSAGNAYLSDFGTAARLFYPEVSSSRSTDPGYRAPEEGERGPSPAGDLYALGVLAQALLGGDPELDAVLARATAPRPDDRYQSAANFLAELDQVVGVEPTELAPQIVSRNPFKGLRAFDEGDTADFHGRDELTTTLLMAVAEHHFVTVVGPSGSGKSSVVRAGLLPALARGEVEGSVEWSRCVFTPGSEPLEALAEAIETVSTEPVDTDTLVEVGLGSVVAGNLLLVIDQFEELYTLVDTPQQRDDFIDLVVEAVDDPASGVRVVSTLRADFYDRPLEDAKLGRLVRDGLVTVLPPTREEVVDMIIAPSQAVGLRWEPGLPQRIAEDVSHQPGGLPLLQYALTELVERRSSDLLTSADYTGVGGVGGALAMRAEALCQSLSPSQQEATRQVMLRLVTVEENTDDTRRRVRRSELESVGIPRFDLTVVLDKLIEQRLLLADRDPATRGPTVEVAHEALLREWPRLQGWVDDQREVLILGRRFRAALGEWAANDEDDDYLLTGSRLAPFIGWAEIASLTSEERDYYRASRDKDEQERLSRRRRRRALTGILAGAAVLATTLGIVAGIQAQKAERNTRLASSRELAASAISLLGEDPELSLLLATAAADSAPEGDSPPLEAVSALHQAIRSMRTVLTRPWDPDLASIALDAEISPDGSLIAATGRSDTLQVWDSETGEVLWETVDEAGSGWYWHPHFSPDGDVLAVAFTRYWTEGRRVENGPASGIYVFDPRSGRLLQVLTSGRACEWVGLPVRNAFTQEGKLVRVVDSGDAPDGCFAGQAELEILDLDSLEVLGGTSLEIFHEEAAESIFLWLGVDLTQGRVLISDLKGGGPTTRMEDLATGEVLWERPAAVGFLSRDGSLAALDVGGAGQRAVELVDPDSGDAIGSLVGHRAEVVDVGFSGDGRLAYTAGHDGTAGVWEVATGRRLMTLTGDRGGLVRLSVDEAGERLAAPGLDDTLRIWDLTEQSLGEVMAVALDPAQIASRGIDAANGRVAVLEFEGQCPDQVPGGLIIDAMTGEVAHQFDDIYGQVVALSAEGDELVHQRPISYGPGIPCDAVVVGSLVVRDTATGSLVRELEGLCEWADPAEDCDRVPPDRPYAEFVTGLSVSPDARFAAAGGPSLGVSTWDLDTGTILSTWRVSELPSWEGHGYVTGVALHPDGSTVAAYTLLDAFGEVVQIREIDGSFIADLDFPANANYSGHIAFSPDGSLLAVGGDRLAMIDTRSWSTSWEAHAHDAGVFHLDFSPDGSKVVTTGSDGFVRIWDSTDGSLLHLIPMGDDWAKAVAFADDRRVVVGTRDGLLATLTIDVDELVELGRSRLTRGLTEQECQTYLHVDSCPTK